MNGNKLLVITGGNGYIGSNLIKQISNKNSFIRTHRTNSNSYVYVDSLDNKVSKNIFKNKNIVLIHLATFFTKNNEEAEEITNANEAFGRKVLNHLIKIFEKQGNFKFIICTGYLGGKIEEHYKERKNVKVVFTGDETETGGRLFKVKDLLEENFLFTYGDGLANVNIKKLINFHLTHKHIGTITVTNPTSRFGLVEFEVFEKNIK